MSLVKTCATWFRHTFSWSNSRQSWEERLGVLALILAALAAWILRAHLSIWQEVVVWLGLGVTAAILMRRGWLKLFGPVLFYDMIRAARRGRYFLLRFLYALLLLFILGCLSLSMHVRGHQQASVLAMSFFETFMLVQLIAVTILTPAYVAGSISEEKDRKTLEFLLATDLRNREIVLSKVGSRLANLTLFVLTGLPMLALIQFLGGVDPNLVLSGFAATGLTMLGLGGISILNSVQFKRPRDAIAITYLFIIAYLAMATTGYIIGQAGGFGSFDFPLWFGSDPPRFGDVVKVLNSGNVIVVIGKVAEAGYKGSLATDLPVLLANYALFHGVLFVGCVFLAIVRLRKVALRQAFGSVRKAARHKWRSGVGDQPMPWKEISVEGGLRLNWMAAIVLILLVIFSMSFGVIMTFNAVLDFFAVRPLGNRFFDYSRQMNVWVRIAGPCVGYLTILAVAVRASTAIGSERDKQTFDTLLTSPLSSGAILWAKFVGSLLSIRLAWLWLGAIWGLGVLTGGLHILALPLVLVSWIVFASFFAGLGLWFSMVARTTTRATVYTILTTIGLSFGHYLISMCCGPLLLFGFQGGPPRVFEYFMMFQASITPPANMGILSFIADDFSHNGGRNPMAEMIGFSILGLFLYGVAGLILWTSVLSPRFRSLTGRDEYRYPERDYYPGEDEDVIR